MGSPIIQIIATDESLMPLCSNEHLNDGPHKLSREEMMSSAERYNPKFQSDQSTCNKNDEVDRPLFKLRGGHNQNVF